MPDDEEVLEERVVSPNEDLAARIVAGLLEQDLIATDDARAVSSALLSGQVRQADWRRWIEHSLYRQEQDDA